MKRTLVAALIAAACVTATANAWTPQKQFGSPIFSYANGKITCIIQRPQKPAGWYIRCDGKLVGGDRAEIARQAAKCAASAKKYGYDSGVGGLAVQANGVGQVNCISDALGGPYRAMPSGATLTAGPFTCAMAAAGMTCRSTQGHGFFFGSASWRTF